MPRELVSLLVGDHFRPPAKLILAHLPIGAPLRLDPEDTNPYDEEAVKIMFDPWQIPESQFEALDSELPAMGFTLEQVMSGGDLQLGYIPKSGGKPLLQAQKEEPGLVGNHEVREAMLDSGHRAQLTFGPDGKARVLVTFDES